MLKQFHPMKNCLASHATVKCSLTFVQVKINLAYNYLNLESDSVLHMKTKYLGTFEGRLRWVGNFPESFTVYNITFGMTVLLNATHKGSQCNCHCPTCWIP